MIGREEEREEEGLSLGFEENDSRFEPLTSLPLTDSEAVKAVYLAPRLLLDVLTALQRLPGASDVIDELIDAYTSTILANQEQIEELDRTGTWSHKALDQESDRQAAALGVLLRTCYCRVGITQKMVEEKLQ